MSIIAIMGFTPSVGRSTLAAALASSFGAAGHRTLLLDVDENGGLARNLECTSAQTGIFDALVGATDIEDSIVSVIPGILDYVGAGKSEKELVELLGSGDFDLAEAIDVALSPVMKDYSVTFWDTPAQTSAPGTLIALVASDAALTVVPPGAYGTIAAPEELADIKIARNFNPRLTFAGHVIVDRDVPAYLGSSSALAEAIKKIAPYASLN